MIYCCGHLRLITMRGLPVCGNNSAVMGTQIRYLVGAIESLNR